jgi:3',5'-cyclic-nucleotide phosphodiesterase/cAMP-specific phosphodiesterase 4
MHCSITFEMLSDEQTSIIAGIPKDSWASFRQTIIHIILATDLQKHFEKLAAFRTILNSEEGFLITNDKHKLTALEICLKCADIGHGAKKLSIHKIWTG